MPLPRVTTALRRVSLRSPAKYQSIRCLSSTASRRVAMADGGRAADDIDLAFDYPSEMQATYTTPQGVNQARLDKEMGYPDQRVLYTIVGVLGAAGLYGAIMGNSMAPPPERAEGARTMGPLDTAAQQVTGGMRDTIGATASDTVHTVKETGKEFMDTASDKMSGAATSGKEFMDSASDKLQEMKPSPSSSSGTSMGRTARSGATTTGIHLPDHKPSDSKMERFIGKGG